MSGRKPGFGGYAKHPLVAEAYALSRENDLVDFYEAYRNQVQAACVRNIPFEFPFLAWVAWWKTEDRWVSRGRGIGKLVMARIGDVGPYHPDNVYVATHSQNISDVDQLKKSASHQATCAARKAAGIKHHLQVRGDGHPRSRAVLTPAGRFGSARLASEHFGITPQGAENRAKKNLGGWQYEDEAPSETPWSNNNLFGLSS